MFLADRLSWDKLDLTGDKMELQGVTGAPYKTPSVRRKLPAPFTRSRIDLDGGRRIKRSWKDVSVLKIKRGDIVAEFGRVEAQSEFITHIDDMPAPIRWRVRLYNVMGEYRDFPGEQRVFAFTPDEDDDR